MCSYEAGSALPDDAYKCPQHDAGSIGSNRVDLAVPAVGLTQQPGRLVVPLSLWDQVPELVVAQAQNELVPAAEMRAQDGFESCVGIVRAGITGDAAVGQFRVDLSRNRGHFRHNALPAS